MESSGTLNRLLESQSLISSRHLSFPQPFSWLGGDHGHQPSIAPCPTIVTQIWHVHLCSSGALSGHDRANKLYL